MECTLMHLLCTDAYFDKGVQDDVTSKQTPDQYLFYGLGIHSEGRNLPACTHV
jgi:hypothetical protein